MNNLIIVEHKEELLDKDVIPFFTLRELMCRCGKCSMSFFDIELLRSLHLFRRLCDFPIKANSCYRCPEHNREVGGVKNSYHMRGMAIDLAFPSDNKKDFFLNMIPVFFTYHKIYPEKNFVHIDNRNYLIGRDLP